LTHASSEGLLRFFQNSDAMPFFQPESFVKFALTLLDAPEIGPATFKAIRTRYPDLSEVFKHPEKVAQELKLDIATRAYLSEPDFEKAEAALKWAEREDHFLLFQDDEDYPILLKDTPGAPSMLFVKGNKEFLNEPQIALVGSRQMSAYGAENAREFAKDLAEKGLTITSGLALGIDTEAHSGALEVGGGTIAVMGTGIDKIYPAINLKLAREIGEHGCLVTEMPFGTHPDKRHFPRRNRIISGLSLGVLVVEAAMKSGSLITARFACEQNREVFAIPGSIHNPLSKGCHALLKSGAKCVESADDILIELKPWLEAQLNMATTGNKETSSSHGKERSKPPHQRTLNSSPNQVIDHSKENFKDNSKDNPNKKSLEGPASLKNPKAPFTDAPRSPDLGELDQDYQHLLSFIESTSTSINQIIDKSGLAPNIVSSMMFRLELDGYVQHDAEGYAKTSGEPLEA
jgi:DNA processing protein